MNYDKFFKIIFDKLFAILILFISSPLLIYGIFVVCKESRGSIFFRQKRVGLNGKIFTLYKLRTMHLNKNRIISQTYLDDKEIFKGGVFLRRYKIDELPQIFNILKGDMSFVAPRPFIPEIYNKGMPRWAKERIRVKPGLTGLAQINGNASLSWIDKWKYDIQYIEKYNFFYDFKIMLITIYVIILGEEKFWKKI